MSLKNILSEREGFYINYLNLLTRKYVEILTAIACEDGIEQPLGKYFLLKYMIGSASTVKSAMTALIEKETIYRDNEKYVIADPFFSEWLKRKYKYYII